MLFHQLRTSVILAVASVFLVFSGCDIFGSDDNNNPKVDEVVVVGTQVEQDFMKTGEFGLTATPLDNGGDAILKQDLKSKIELTHESSSSTTQIEAHDLSAKITIDRTNNPSNQDLVASVSMDGSGSMDTSDPNNLRVDGAKAFFDELDASGVAFESGIFEFNGSNVNPDLSYNTVLQNYTDNIDSLKAAAEQVSSFGGTPMYTALEELLTYSDSVRSKSNFEKAIVLFADGKPSDEEIRDSVCAQSKRLESPIYGIGLGPASDISDSPSSPAIAEMRYISNCSNATYKGLSADSLNTAITEAFQAVGTASAKGSVSMNVSITDGLDQVQAGGIIKGNVKISSGGNTAGGDFSFRVPDSSSTSTSFKFK